MRTGNDLSVDILFVALTRPTTMWGVPYMAFIIEFMLVTLVFLATGNPFYLLIIVPLHGILYLVSAHDPGIFDSLYVWSMTTGRCRNSRFWGAASFSPLSMKRNDL
jgi:Type IV secretory pathway, VirB3 components